MPKKNGGARAIPTLNEVFALREAPMVKWVIVRGKLHDGAKCIGPFSTEQSARQFLEKKKSQPGEEGGSWSYDDDNGDIDVIPLETPVASSVTGGKI